MSATTLPISQWWRIADVGVFLAWITIVAFTLQHHEKWADEAQAWLLARDLDLRTLWFHELRYEGSPGLWHTILWGAQHVFHLPYAALGIIGFLCAAAGVAFLLWKAPFPRPVRYLIAFSYFIVYQYAVIARPYNLLPLLLFLSAYLFRDRDHPERLAFTLILLANVSAHGMLLAACIGTAYLLDELRAWPQLESRVRQRFLLSAVALVLVACFLFFVLKPPGDVEALQQNHHRTLAALATRTLEGFSGAFFDNAVLSLAWFALACAWCWQRKRLGTFLVPVIILAVFYGAIYGWVHHQGTIFLAAIMGLWIAWPTGEGSTFVSRERITHYAFIAALIALLGYQVWNSAVVIQHEYQYPYSGAEDAARYLKSAGADRQQVFGYLYGMVAVQAYFDHNIQANSPTAYFHHGAPFRAANFDVTQVESFSPEYIVVPCWFDVNDTFKKVYQPNMASHGYYLAHFSDGYMLFKRGVAMRQVYFIFRRQQ